MAIKVFADGANLEGMLDMHDNGNVQGFTTNPSLMKAGGVTDFVRQYTLASGGPYCDCGYQKKKR